MYEPQKGDVTKLALKGERIIQDKSEILDQYAEHFDSLLNMPES